MNMAETAVQAQGAGVISRAQVVELLRVAQAAWRAQTAAGLTADGFDVWRGGTLFDAVHLSSFRSVRQSEFNVVLALFHKLAGNTIAAMATESASGANDQRRRAAFALKAEIAKCADVLGGAVGATRYAEAIAWNKYRTGIEGLSAKQVWCVFFTIRNRANKKRQEAKQLLLGV